MSDPLRFSELIYELERENVSKALSDYVMVRAGIFMTY